MEKKTDCKKTTFFVMYRKMYRYRGTCTVEQVQVLRDII